MIPDQLRILSRNILWIRKNKFKNQQDLADRLGKKKASVSQWENGDSSLSIETLIGLSQVSGYSLDDLCFTDLEKGTSVNKPAPEEHRRDSKELKALADYWFSESEKVRAELDECKRKNAGGLK